MADTEILNEAQPEKLAAPKDRKEELETLTAKATQQYSIKQYAEAADLYAQATEIQAEINGEMSPENAELLYLYGKSLYQVGVSKSDVLGGNVANEAQKSDQGLSNAGKSASSNLPSNTGTQKKQDEPEDESKSPQKPFFQFTGDENFDNAEDEENGDGVESENEDAENGDGKAEEEEEDDLAQAWTVLDFARLLFSTRLEEISGSSQGKETEPSKDQRHIKQRLADTHDLLAEISLEGERFPEAAADFRSSLYLRKELFPIESPLIGEGHFKLSLALEFASTTSPQENGAPADAQKPEVDEDLKAEAISELEAAIHSTTLRIKHEEELLQSQSKEELQKAKISQTGINDVKEIVADMRQRLKDLRGPPLGLQSTLSSILADSLGGKPAKSGAEIESAAKNATDLSGLVRRKKPDEKTQSPSSTAENGTTSNGKRKAEEEVDATEQKKPKPDDSA